MMSLTFGLFTQVSGSGPLGPLVVYLSTILNRFDSYREEINPFRAKSFSRRPHFGSVLSFGESNKMVNKDVSLFKK